MADADAGDGNGAVFRVDVRTGATETLASGGVLRHPTGLTLAKDGRLYVTGNERGGGRAELVEIDRATGEQRIVARPGGAETALTGLAAAPRAGVYWTRDERRGPDAVERFDPATRTVRTVASGGLLGTPVDLTVGRDGSLYVANASGTIVRVDPATGAQARVGTGGRLSGPGGIAAGPDGALYVTDGSDTEPGEVLVIDPRTGAQRRVSRPATEPFVDLNGVEVAGRGGLYVSDGDRFGGAIVRVDRATGDVTTLARGDRPTGGAALSEPEAMAVEPAARAAAGVARSARPKAFRSVLPASGFVAVPRRPASPSPSDATPVSGPADRPSRTPGPTGSSEVEAAPEPELAPAPASRPAPRPASEPVPEPVIRATPEGAPAPTEARVPAAAPAEAPVERVVVAPGERTRGVASEPEPEPAAAATEPELASPPAPERALEPALEPAPTPVTEPTPEPAPAPEPTPPLWFTPQAPVD